MKKETLAIVTVVKNEEKYITGLIDSIKDADSDIFFLFDDGCTDKTISVYSTIRVKTKQCLMKSFMISEFDHLLSEPSLVDFSNKKNIIREQLKEYTWLLWIDADERFDPYFLRHIRKIISDNEPSLSFAFPRINLPSGQDYPDYQVRLIKNTGVLEWRGKVHEAVYPVDHEKSVLDIINSPEDISCNSKGINYCIKLDQYKIIHLARRTDIKRPWW